MFTHPPPRLSYSFWGVDDVRAMPLAYYPLPRSVVQNRQSSCNVSKVRRLDTFHFHILDSGIPNIRNKATITHAMVEQIQTKLLVHHLVTSSNGQPQFQRFMLLMRAFPGSQT